MQFAEQTIVEKHTNIHTEQIHSNKNLQQKN